jgi:predicted membrane protein
MATIGEGMDVRGGRDGTRHGIGAALAAFAIFMAIAGGAYMAWQRGGGAAREHDRGMDRSPWIEIAPGVRMGAPGSEVKDDGAKVEVATFMGPREYVSRAQGLRRGEIVAIMGHATLDLTEAQLAEAGGRIEAVAICGRATIRVPQDWTVKAVSGLALGVLQNMARDGEHDPTKVVRVEAVVLAGKVEVTH